MSTATAARGLAHLIKVSTCGRGIGSFAGDTITTMFTKPTSSGPRSTLGLLNAPPLFQPFAGYSCPEQQR